MYKITSSLDISLDFQSDYSWDQEFTPGAIHISVNKSLQGQAELHQAIVLQNLNPRKKKLCLLDQELGKIEGTLSPISKIDNIAPGMVINYFIRTWRTVYVFYDVEIIDEPSYFASHDILFIHHVLELCTYFLPFNDNCEPIFHLVKQLYVENNLLQSNISKKLFLCKFFALVGIYPENAASYGAQFFNLISQAINSKFEKNKFDMNSFETDNHTLHSKLRSWLLSCVAAHPQAHTIKTIHFLHSLD